MISKFQIAGKNLLRKKARTLLTLLGIMLSSWVLVSLLGFNRDIISCWSDGQHRFGAGR